MKKCFFPGFAGVSRGSPGVCKHVFGCQAAQAEALGELGSSHDHGVARTQRRGVRGAGRRSLRGKGSRWSDTAGDKSATIMYSSSNNRQKQNG